MNENIESYLYKCDNCSKQFVPKRRGKQKFCSNSCRTLAYIKRNNLKFISITIENKDYDFLIETLNNLLLTSDAKSRKILEKTLKLLKRKTIDKNTITP